MSGFLAKQIDRNLCMNNIEVVGAVSSGIKIRRAIWNVVCTLLFRTCPTKVLWWWRWLLLRLFGAQVDYKAHVYSTAKIWAPWNLRMEAGSCLGPHVICYNQALVSLECNATVSQYAYLCTAGHKTDELLTAESGLIVAPIIVRQDAWIGTRAYVGIGVEIGDHAIVGATASVYKDVEPWTVVGGNPAKFIKKREIQNNKS